MSPNPDPQPSTRAAVGEETSADTGPANAGPSDARDEGRVIVRGRSHMPTDSVFFERVIPLVLAGMGIVALALILIAAGVLLGFVPFR